MTRSRGRNGPLLALTVALVLVLPLFAAPTAGAQEEDPDRFTCRASVVRTEGFAEEPVNLNQEEGVANEQNDPCETDSDPVLNALNPLIIGDDLVVVRALYAETTNEERFSRAQAGVVETTITVQGHTIVAEALTSEARAQCGPGAAKPELTGESTLLRLTIDGQEIEPIDTHQHYSVDGITVHVNHQEKTASKDKITQRALFVETPAGDVIVAEAIADFRGNPCKTDGNGNGNGNGGGPGDGDNGGEPGDGDGAPECSDEVDNDGDGFIDYPNDPGCTSPQDDDETDPAAPQCSDGIDNDGDGFIDYPSDPGCENRDDDDETDNDAPECSDGVDNDGDGTIDFPADSGCESPADDDEAAGFMTGGGGYDEIDKKTANEDFVNPGEFLRYGTVLPCDVGDNPGPNLNVTWHDPGLQGHFRLVELVRAFCRNDPFITPGNPQAEFDTYVGEGTGTFRPDGLAGVEVPARAEFIVIDRGEPGGPPVIGVDFFSIRVTDPLGVVPLAEGVGTLDHGNNQAHTPGGQFRSRAA